MSIPPLQANGTLPPGEYHATVAEVVARFPPTTRERQELNQALQDVVLALKKLPSQAPDMIVYINGSFITSKPSPNDIDMLILTDFFAERHIKAYLNQEAPLAFLALDLYAERVTGGTSATIINVFSFTRNNRPKGIIVLDM